MVRLDIDSTPDLGTTSLYFSPGAMQREARRNCLPKAFTTVWPRAIHLLDGRMTNHCADQSGGANGFGYAVTVGEGAKKASGVSTAWGKVDLFTDRRGFCRHEWQTVARRFLQSEKHSAPVASFLRLCLRVRWTARTFWGEHRSS